MMVHNLSREDFVRLKPHTAQAGAYLDYLLESHAAPIGYSKFKGDQMPEGWTINPFFEKGKIYPVYFDGDNEFVIGKDGNGYKREGHAWTKLKN